MLYPTASSTQTISVLSFIVPPRMRNDNAEIRIKIENNLVPSIKENGLIHPILLNEFPEERSGFNLLGTPVSSKFVLGAGWSRSIAFTMLDYEDIPYNSRYLLSDSELAAIELCENLDRNPFTWQEACVGIARVHRLRQKESHKAGLKWGNRETGTIIGKSLGYVSEMLGFADLIEANDRELIEAPTYSMARNIVTLRKQVEGEKYLRELTDKNITQAQTVIKQISGQLPPKLNLLTPSLTNSTIEQVPSLSSSVPPNERVTKIPLSSMLFNMDSVFPQSDGSPSFFDQAQAESVDLVYTDHPFAIEMDNLDLVNLERVKNSHEVEENKSQFEPFLRGAYKVLKPNSYLLFWMDLAHWNPLLELAESVGFSVQPYPLIWLKTHSCKNQAAHCHWTKATEYVMVCRKGKASLKTPQMTNYFSCSGSAERKLQVNPFAKPFEFSRWLLEPIITPGMTVLDCYAGGGSLLRACLRLNCRIIGVEKGERDFNQLVENMKQVFDELTIGKVEFV